MSDKGQQGIPHDAPLAFSLFSKLVSICSNPDDQAVSHLSERERKKHLQYGLLYLGYLYEKGRGCTQDHLQSFRCYSEAVELGPIAEDESGTPDKIFGSILCSLGGRYEVRLGDWKKARELYERAVDEKENQWYDIYPCAYFALGYLLERGGGGPAFARDQLGTTTTKAMAVEQDTQLAFKCYEKLELPEHEEGIKSTIDSLEEFVIGKCSRWVCCMRRDFVGKNRTCVRRINVLNMSHCKRMKRNVNKRNENWKR
jgi:tetratricopeptide (TPR) repeat protein